MKFTLKNSLLFLAVCMMSIVACSDDDEEATPTPSNNNNNNGDTTNTDTTDMVLKATIDAETINFDPITVNIASEKINIVGTFSADSMETKRITLSIPENANTQTYQFPQTTNITVSYRIGNTNYTSAGQMGSLTLTSNDVDNKHIAGTFDITVNSVLEGNIDIENGEFDINYE